jgi:hypothetical protein
MKRSTLAPTAAATDLIEEAWDRLPGASLDLQQVTQMIQRAQVIGMQLERAAQLPFRGADSPLTIEPLRASIGGVELPTTAIAGQPIVHP